MKSANKFIKSLKKDKLVYLMILPGALLVAVFAYAPLYGWWMAFSDYKLGKPIFSAEFVGLEYFKEFFSDTTEAFGVIRNTLGINILSLIIGLLAAMAFALLLNEVSNTKLKKIVQTASFFPFFISWVIVYNIFNTFFASESGLVNLLLVNLGLIDNGLNILGDPKYSWVLIIGSNVWKTLGYNAVLFLSAITGIDSALYEAADIDGADRIQKNMYITIPSLMPTLQVLAVLNVGWIFASNFDQYYLFTNTMNKETMMVFDTYIYDMGLKNLRYSYATAVGIVKSIASIVTILSVNAFSKKVNGEGLFLTKQICFFGKAQKGVLYFMSAVLSACRRFFNKTFPIYNFLILLLIFIITAYPFWYILIYSLSDPARVGSEFLMFPIGFNLNAYRKAFESADLLRAFFISVGRSVIGTVLGAFITVMAAYGLSKKDLYGRKGITIYFIITMYFSAGMIPAYMVIKGLGLTGSFWVYILPLAMNAYNMVLMKSYIENIPDSMNESARLDGANDFVIFARIIIPLCIPVIAAVSLFTAVNHWNSYTDTLIYCSSKPELYTLQYVLMSLINNMASASTSTSAIAGLAASQTNVTALSVRMAVTIITILPISLLYPFLQKYFIKGIMVGAVKG